MKNAVLLASASLAVLIAVPASAATSLLTANPGGGTTTTFTTTGNNGFGNPGPVNINGFSVTGAPQATYGDASYFIPSNGQWSNFSWVATNNPNGSITFDLGGNYGFVGGFMNYAPGSGAAPTITALNAALGVLGTYDLSALAPIVTPGATNGGAFRGIQSTGNDIRYFTLSGSYILAHDLTVGNGAVPEPATWAIMLLGFGGVGYAMRRRPKVSTRIRFA